MSKSLRAILGLVVIIIIAAVLVAVFHKSPNKANNSSTSTGNSSQSGNTPAVNNSVLLTKSSSSLGQYLTDPSGKPLYTYNADTANTSNCTGACLTNWPAYVATSTTSLPSGVTTFKRTDNGAMQYAYNGKPLYYFTSDSAGGQPTGNGVENFVLAVPSSASSSGSSSNSNSSSGYPY